MKSRNPTTAVRAGRQRVRITGGAWRSRVLDFPAVPGLRPTPDRVRQTLFNWLGQELGGRICLDLFAGSGALGFDALSRNAARVVMVERDPQVRATLAASARALDVGARLLLAGYDALQFLRDTDERFDLIFVDPPFNQGWLDKLLPHLCRVMSPGGLVYLESADRCEPPSPWVILRAGRAGVVHYHLMSKHGSTHEHDQSRLSGDL